MEIGLRAGTMLHNVVFNIAYSLVFGEVQSALCDQ
jgi:hypothetical protein